MQIGYILVGLALGSLGWLLYRAGLTIVGAMVGAGLGGSIGYLLCGAFNLENTGVVAGIGLVIGIIIGILLIKALLVYFFFATGAALGAAVAMHFIGDSQAGGSAQGLLIAFCGLVGGLLLVYLRRYVVALISAVFGAVILSMGLPPEYQSVGMIVALVVFVAAQIGLVKRFVDQEAFDARTRHRVEEN